MMKKTVCVFTLLGLVAAPFASAQQGGPVAPQAPVLEIEESAVVPAMPAASAPKPAPKAAPRAAANPRPAAARRAARPAAATNPELMGKTAPGVQETLAAQADVSVEAVAAPMPAEGLAAPAGANAPAEAAVPAAQGEDFVVQREEMAEEVVEVKAPRVVYNPKNRRDPTLSPDDFLLLQYREQQRLAALEAERQRKLAEERRKREEAERLRQLELARIKDPTREVRNKIRVGGIIGQEVFIGSKIYTVGKSIYGARIVEVRPDEVVFSYKGHKFVRKVQL